MRFRESKSLEEKSELNRIAFVNSQSIKYHVTQYNEIAYIEHQFHSLDELNRFLLGRSSDDKDSCTWLNITGIHQARILDQLSIRFNLHPLVKEDISRNNERIKVDLLDNGSAIYLLMKMIHVQPDIGRFRRKQISLILQKNNFLVTFEEAKDKGDLSDVFHQIKNRLKHNRGRIRSLKIDYLFYCLIDALIENYMSALDYFAEEIDRYDKTLMKKFKHGENHTSFFYDLSSTYLQKIHHMKHSMLSFRILCQPLREIILKLQKAQDQISKAAERKHYRRNYRRNRRPQHKALTGNSFFNPDPNTPVRRRSLEPIVEKAPLFNEGISIYFKDLNDRIIQLNDRVDTHIDLLSSLIVFNRILDDYEINQAMKCFALITVVFVPLMFINGLFSMNYDNMPPLEWQQGYFCVLAVLGACALSMISFFKWKKWL